MCFIVIVRVKLKVKELDAISLISNPANLIEKTALKASDFMDQHQLFSSKSFKCKKLGLYHI